MIGKPEQDLPMHQLIILLPAGLDLRSFDEGWPEFLEIAEQMPGLIQESVTRFNQVLFGTGVFQRMYSFSFKDPKSLEKALLSEAGQQAGNILHMMGGENLIILTAEYQADSLSHIQSYSASGDD
jgi:hypothetical protein